MARKNITTAILTIPDSDTEDLLIAASDIKLKIVTIDDFALNQQDKEDLFKLVREFPSQMYAAMEQAIPVHENNWDLLRRIDNYARTKNGLKKLVADFCDMMPVLEYREDPRYFYSKYETRGGFIFFRALVEMQINVIKKTRSRSARKELRIILGLPEKSFDGKTWLKMTSWYQDSAPAFTIEL